MQHFMIDLETMGTRPYSVIASIGVIQFDLDTGKLGKQFYQTIDERSCIKAGLTKDPDTVEWWGRQDPEVRAKLLINTQPLTMALTGLADFLRDCCPSKSMRRVWGNAASFDIGLLNCAYEQTHILPPWDFWAERCCRTIVELNPEIKMAMKTPRGAHDPIVDCKFQIDYVVKTIESVKWKKR